MLWHLTVQREKFCELQKAEFHRIYLKAHY